MYGPMLPILMVVSLIPCRLSAPAGAAPRVSVSTASPRITRKRARVFMFMFTSTECWLALASVAECGLVRVVAEGPLARHVSPSARVRRARMSAQTVSTSAGVGGRSAAIAWIRS